jgi:hypothetical protein
VTVGTGAGMLISEAQNACGTGPADTLHIIPALSPAAATSIVAPAILCAGNSDVFYTPAVANAISYIWTVSGTGWSGSSTSDSITLSEGTGTGTITVEAQNTCGTGTPYTLQNLIVTPVPTATFSLTSHVAIPNQTVTATFAGSTTGTPTYSWDFGGGTASPGTGGGPQTVSWATTGMKYITLTVTVNGCVSAQYIDSVNVSKTNGISDINIQLLDINVVPNPSNGSFEIQFSEALSKPFTLAMTDLQGRTVYTNEYAAYSKTAAVNAQNLAAAMYIATINCEGQTVSKRVEITK